MDKDEARVQLAGIIEVFEGVRGELGTVRFYELLARKLWGTLSASEQDGARKGLSDGWSWRYVQGVEKGTVRPGEKFGEAVRRLGEALDGRRVEHTGLVEMRVLVREGAILEGTIVLGKSRWCARPGCLTRFVGRSPRQRFCSRECREGLNTETRRRNLTTDERG